MDFNKLGKMAEAATRQALDLIKKEQSKPHAVKKKDDPHAATGKSVTIQLDVLAQRVYTDLFAAETPDIGIVAEEKDPLLKKTHKPGRPVWVIDGVDGTKRFIEKAPSGYGTQCALLLADGSVPIALVGDATTGEIFGYYGKSGVFRIDERGRQSIVKDVVRKRSLSELGGLRRPPIDEYHSLSKRILRSGKVGTVCELSGGIGSTMALLLTDQIGIFALRPHHEKPWDAIPAYALCAAADMAFMTPAPDGQRLVEWQPSHTPYTYKRDFDLLVVHRSRVNALHDVAEHCA